MSNSVGRFFTTLMAKILFTVLIIAFGAWGIADMLRSNPNREAVISVGDVNVSTLQVRRAFIQDLRNLRQNFGPQLTAAQAAKFGVFDRTLSQMASRALLDAAALDMNVGISDKAMQNLIMSNKAFLDQNGKFSRERFHRVLENSGYTEKDFLNTTRSDMTRKRLIDSVSAPVIAPKFLVSTLLRYEGERRVVQSFNVRASSIPAPKDPGDKILEAYQKTNTAKYTAPETRKLTVLPIRPQDVVNKIKISDKELKTYFNENIDEFRSTETRNLSQILAKNKETADKIVKALHEGRSMETVAKAEKLSVTNLGWVDKNSILESIAVPTFAAAKNDILNPIQTPLGWHIITIKDIRPGKAPDFEAARKKVTAALKSAKTLTALYDASTALDDTLASGATLEEAAKLQGLSIVTLPNLTANGTDPKGKPAQGVPAVANVAKAGYAQAEGEQSTLLEYDGEPGGYFVVRTDAVTPAALKAFKTIRSNLLKAWSDDEQHKAAVAKAKTLAESFTKAKDVKSFAKAQGVKLTTSTPIYRSERNPTIPAELIHSVFASEIGQASSAASPSGAVVARLKSVLPVNLDEFKDSLAQGTLKLKANLSNTLMMPFTTQLTETYDMRQHRSVTSLVQELN